MKLTEQQIKYFSDAAKNGDVFTIKGFNDINQIFETNGRVTFDDKGEPGAYEEEIFFEFGKPKCYKEFRGETYCPFSIDIDMKYLFEGSALIVVEILDSNGNIVLKNEDAEKYLEIVQKREKTFKERLQSEGRNITEENIDPLTKKVPFYIGKPVIIDNDKPYVLLSYKGANNFGDTMLNVGIATLVGGARIESCSSLQTIDLDGNRILVEKNNEEDNAERWERRRRNIFEKNNAKTTNL